MDKNVILLGNCLEVLKTLPDNSINCCVTSPPYYALRDYGTGTWVGGDPNCDHVIGSFGNSCSVGSHKKMKELGMQAPGNITKHVCPKCGAVRVDEQIGLEETPEDYIKNLVDVFTEVRRVLTDDGTLWVNIGDTYAGSSGGRGTSYHDSRTDVVQSANKGFNDMLFAPKITDLPNLKPKDLIGIPWMLAFALRESGWYLRQDIIWNKPNPMPESVKDRCTKSHEYLFFLTKSRNYYFDQNAIKEPSVSADDPRVFGKLEQQGTNRNDIGNVYSGSEYRNKRDVWTVVPSHYKEAHFATYPEELISPCILAGCPRDGIVLDPFMGSGTTGAVAKKNNRNYIGIELNPEYKEMAERRIKNTKKRLF